jgi:cobaltochelatase CobN
MSDFVEYLWGWDMTTEGLVDEAKWQQTYEVYVTDKYDLDLKAFFDKASPWAFQSIAGRMLETHRKGYWQAGHEQLQTLAAEYAGSVVSRGIACCDHTCNNPLLNQMVVSIISIPGVVSPELAAQFKLAVEQMARQPLDQQVEERHQLIDQLNAPSPDQQPSKPLSASADDSPENQMVEGYKMEKIKSEDDTTQMTSSGIQWMAVLCVIAVMALVSAGACKSVRRTS